MTKNPTWTQVFHLDPTIDGRDRYVIQHTRGHSIQLENHLFDSDGNLQTLEVRWNTRDMGFNRSKPLRPGDSINLEMMNDDYIWVYANPSASAESECSYAVTEGGQIE